MASCYLLTRVTIHSNMFLSFILNCFFSTNFVLFFIVNDYRKMSGIICSSVHTPLLILNKNTNFSNIFILSIGILKVGLHKQQSCSTKLLNKVEQLFRQPFTFVQLCCATFSHMRLHASEIMCSMGPV